MTYLGFSDDIKRKVAELLGCNLKAKGWKYTIKEQVEMFIQVVGVSNVG